MGTGIKGIRQEASGHYSAHLKVGKRQEHLGTFKSIEEAVDVWQMADQKRGLMIKKRQNFKTNSRRIILRKIPIQEEEAEANKEQDAKPFDTQDIVHYHDTEAEDRSATTESLYEESSSLLQRFKEEELLSTISDLQKELRSRDNAAAATKQSYDAELCEKNLVIKEQHNLIQNLTGQIRVFCRVRPLTEVETAAGFKCVVDLDGSNKGDIGIMDAGGTKKTFKFDKVYTPNDEQGTVYADVSPLVTTVMDGFNVCIFAYGPTGSGKTFTMEGIERNRGVNYRTLEELFKIVEERINNFDYKLSVIMLEIYNDDIRDLLATSPPSEKLEIRETDEGTHHVNGVEEVPINDIKQVWHLLQKGSKSRAKGSNNVNVHSSRSHCALSVVVRGKNLINGDITRSALWLVDLAGSERLPKTGTEGERLKEAICINQSLSALGDVISAIVDRKSHIPYRNSKLTQLLQDSLGGGDSKTTMILHVSPSDNAVLETSCSLKFGSRVRSVKLGPAKKHFQGVEVTHKVKTVRPTATASRVRQQANKNPFSGPESCHTWSARP